MNSETKTNIFFFCFSSVKNVIGNLIGITLNLQIAFGSIVIFTILIIPIQKHVSPETIKLLEENIGRTLDDINQSKILV